MEHSVESEGVIECEGLVKFEGVVECEKSSSTARMCVCGSRARMEIMVAERGPRVKKSSSRNLKGKPPSLGRQRRCRVTARAGSPLGPCTKTMTEGSKRAKRAEADQRIFAHTTSELQESHPESRCEHVESPKRVSQTGKPM